MNTYNIHNIWTDMLTHLRGLVGQKVSLYEVQCRI